MNVDEVPQDNSASIRKAMYAIGANGQYTTVESNGWQVEKTATCMAIAEFEQQLTAAYDRCLAGESSTLEYHMYAHRMDLATLADTVGMARWRVRRHLRASVFARLPDRLLQRYAEALHTSTTALTQLPQQPHP